MSEEVTVSFAGETLEVNLYDPLSADALSAIAGYAAAGSEDAADAEAAAAIALAAAVAADWRAARRARRLAGARAAAGNGTVKLVLTDDCERTYAGGVGPTLATLTAETGQVFTATVPAFGDPVRAFQTADGIVPSRGLGLTGATIVETGDCSFDLFFIQPPVAGSFATLAAMNAAVGTFDPGEVVYAANPAAVMANTYGNDQPPADTLLGLANTGTDFNQGYWTKRPAPFLDFARYSQTMLGAGLAADPGNRRFEMAVDVLGRLNGFVFRSGTGTGVASPRSYRQDMIAHDPGAVQQLRLDQRDGVTTLRWNGDEVNCDGYLGRPALDFVMDFLNLAGPWTLKALVATQGCDFTEKRAVSDFLAAEFGTPSQRWTPIADIALFWTQSEFTVSTNTGESWQPYTPSGWGGEVAGRTNFDIGQDVFQPGVFSTRSLVDSASIGPVHFAAGLGGGGSEYGSIEGIRGYASEWRRRTGGDNDLYVIGECVGGASLAILDLRSDRYLHAIGEGAVSAIGASLYGELGDRAIIEVLKRIEMQGQEPRLIELSNFEGKTDVARPDTVAEHVADLVLRYNRAKALMGRGQSRPPLTGSMALNYTYAGVSIETNAAGVDYVDDKYRRMTASRTDEFPILPLASVSKFCGPGVHWTVENKDRLMAFRGGRAADHMLLGKYIRLLEPVGVPVLGTGGDAGKVVITWPRAVVAEWADDVTNPSKVLSGGFDSFGFGIIDAIGPGLAINGNVTLTDAAGGGFLKVKIPYSGAWAVGDRLTYLGLGALHGNIREAAANNGVFNGQDWGGVFPIPAVKPARNYAGPLWDLREGAAAFSFIFDGAVFT